MDEQSTFMPDLTLGYGLFLVLWGVAVSVLSDSQSVTSFFRSLPRSAACHIRLDGQIKP